MNRDANSTVLMGISIILLSLGFVAIASSWAVALIGLVACFGTLMACVGAEDRE